MPQVDVHGGGCVEHQDQISICEPFLNFDCFSTSLPSKLHPLRLLKSFIIASCAQNSGVVAINVHRAVKLEDLKSLI